MSFSKAQRFNPDKVCGPPPTAYNPKLLAGGGTVSFPKGERFQDGSTMEGQMTRAHSSSSVGSSDSTSTNRSQKGKKLDHSHCNKQIADMEKELRNVTLERNQLMIRLRSIPAKSTTTNEENKENDPTADAANQIALLNEHIVELQLKLDSVKDMEEDMEKLENERDNVLADLELKEMEVASINTQIEELRVTFKQEEEAMRQELETALKSASEEKEQMEAQISDLGLKLENLENVKVELSKEIESVKEEFQKELATEKVKHKEELERRETKHSEEIQQLENNLQQLAAEHDAESEQIKFEYSVKIEEINQNHLAEVDKLESEHAAQFEQIQLAHQTQVSLLQTSRDQLEAEHSRLRQKYEEASVTLETKLDQVETLNTQLEVAKEKMDVSLAQAEEKFESMKRALELDIVECKARFEEQRRNKEQELRAQFECEFSNLNKNNQELCEMLQARQAQLQELELTHSTALAQFEEQIKRLNDNNQTEKEIMLWQMTQQRENLELEYETRMTEKDAEFQRESADWETKMNQAKEEYENELTSIQSDHNIQLNNYCELHEAALENLEREKNSIIEERTKIEEKLQEKECEIEKLSVEMRDVTSKLELELEMLRESNNQLVFDLIRTEQERQLVEERLGTEKIELKVQAEQEKNDLVQSYEETINSIQTELMQKSDEIIQLSNKLSFTEESSLKQLEEKEEIFAEYQKELNELRTVHEEKISELHKSYEQVILDKNEKHFAEHEKLISAHQEEVEALKNNSQAEMQHLENEMRISLASLEGQFANEKEEIAEQHAKELAEINKNFEDKLATSNAHHETVIEILNKNYEEALDNVQELQETLDDLRAEFQSSLANFEKKEAQFKLEIENSLKTIEMKDEELVKLQRREKETADEWIARETAIMTEHKSTMAEFESLQSQLQNALTDAEQLRNERDLARDDVAVFQVQTEAQLAALNEQYDQERAMLVDKLSQQMREIEDINAAKLSDVQAQLIESQRNLEELRWQTSHRMEQMEHEREEAVLTAVREAMEPVDSELESLRKDREAYHLLRKEFQELQARIEPFREQLEMFEAEKKALLSQAQTAESSMANLATKYTQLLGHQNSRQKIHHLEKLKQDIFNLRKELTDKNLALEKEKKARQKADARLKELTGSKSKYDPAEAFKVPENPAAAKAARPSRASVAEQRKPLRAQVGGGFFITMDDVEKTGKEMEQEKQRKLDARRLASANFEAFDVDFGGGNARRDTFDVPPSKLNVTHNINDPSNKENSSLFSHDISGISISEELVQKKLKSARSDNLTSTPLQRHPN